MDLDALAADYAAFKKRVEPMIAAYEAENGAAAAAAFDSGVTSENRDEINAPLPAAEEAPAAAKTDDDD